MKTWRLVDTFGTIWQGYIIGCFAVNRGPNKRQIKPAENNSLLQLALGEDSEDSEEDEDFEINDDDDDEGSDQY